MAPAGRKRTKRGFVYVAFNPTWPGTCKVGISVNIRDRQTTLNCADPYRQFDMRGWAEFANAREAEKEIHRRLAEFRLGGEWFAIHPDMALQELRNYEEEIHELV